MKGGSRGYYVKGAEIDHFNAKLVEATRERDRLAALVERYERAILTYVDLLKLERIPDAELECPEMQAQNELVDIAAALASQEARHDA